MTYKEKMQSQNISQIIDEAAMCSGSIDYIHGNKLELIVFALPAMYATFYQEDMLLLLIRNIVYRVLVVRIEFKGDCCIVRCLIKDERAREKTDALGG